MTSSESTSYTHYQVLGVARTAPAKEIRTAYRTLARAHHPDRRGGRTTPEMLRINEAWRVLSSPQRRHEYDTRLLDRDLVEGDPSPHLHQRVDRSGPPARFPWRFVFLFCAVVTIVIIVVGAFTDTGDPVPIDNVVRVGSCVDVDVVVQEAWEVDCDGPHDAQVTQMVPFDGTCPARTVGYRDRQGLGLVCTPS